jgi:hypothetical protein
VEQRKAAPHARLQANDNNKGRLLMIMHAIVLDEKSCGSYRTRRTYACPANSHLMITTPISTPR